MTYPNLISFTEVDIVYRWFLVEHFYQLSYKKIWLTL